MLTKGGNGDRFRFVPKVPPFFNIHVYIVGRVI